VYQSRYKVSKIPHLRVLGNQRREERRDERVAGGPEDVPGRRIGAGVRICGHRRRLSHLFLLVRHRCRHLLTVGTTGRIGVCVRLLVFGRHSVVIVVVVGRTALASRKPAVVVGKKQGGDDQHKGHALHGRVREEDEEQEAGAKQRVDPVKPVVVAQTLLFVHNSTLNVRAYHLTWNNVCGWTSYLSIHSQGSRLMNIGYGIRWSSSLWCWSSCAQIWRHWGCCCCGWVHVLEKWSHKLLMSSASMTSPVNLLQILEILVHVRVGVLRMDIGQTGLVVYKAPRMVQTIHVWCGLNGRKSRSCIHRGIWN